MRLEQQQQERGEDQGVPTTTDAENELELTCLQAEQNRKIWELEKKTRELEQLETIYSGEKEATIKDAQLYLYKILEEEHSK